MADAIEGTLRALGYLRANPPAGVPNNPGFVFDGAGNLTGVQNKAGARSAIGGGGGGSTAPALVAFSSAIPLDAVDPGKSMAAGGLVNVVFADTVLTVAAGAVEGGVCKCVYQYDGVHTLDFTTNFYNSKGFAPADTLAGSRISLTFVAEGLAYGRPLVFGTDLDRGAAPPVSGGTLFNPQRVGTAAIFA